MKTSSFKIALPVFVLAAAISTNLSQAQPVASAVPVSNPGQPTLQLGTYQIAERDANSQVWQRQTYDQAPDGSIVTNIHKYIELATGLNHLVNGQWLPSKEEIDISPDGNSAAATNGQHQVYFPGDIAQGVIDLVTPDGKQLQSRPIGLSYDDGRNTVLIAVLTNSPGYLVVPNQVIYPNAFMGVQAGLLYTYTKAGFEQNVILRAQPPPPESFGLNPQTTRLQVLTEFFDPPQPTVTSAIVPTDAGGLTDDNLDFGTMQIGRGSAFLLGTNSSSVSVNKQWLLLNGRQLLVEEVPVVSIAAELESLPLPTSQTSSTATTLAVSRNLILPPQRLAKTTAKAMLMVKGSLPTQGLVLDYNTLNSRQTNYSFRGDTTYYISGRVYLFGTNRFEGGAVIKYTNNAALFNSSTTSPQVLATAYRPVIFTAQDDNSVGDTISVSTGNPTNYYAYVALSAGASGNVSLQNMRIAFAQMAITAGNQTLNLTNMQFINCQNGVMLDEPYQSLFLNMRNVLMANVQTNINLAALYGAGAFITAQNVTFANTNAGSGSSTLVGQGSSPNWGMTLTNCILANMNFSSYISGHLSGNYNGFYPAYNAFGSEQFGTMNWPFQSVGAGNYYSANSSPFRNVGTPNIDPMLLADLQQKTTYPPQLLTNQTVAINTTLNPLPIRDTAAAPDLGYHYDPIDYIAEMYAVTNATLTIAGGTVIACYNDTGIWLQDGSAIISIGTAVAPNWFTYYLSVQEQSVSLGAYSNLYYAQDVTPYYVGSVPPNGVFQFSKLALPAGGIWQFNDRANSSYGNLLIQDCEIWNGYNDFSGAPSATATVNNTLFARSRFYADDNASIGYSLSLSNNLFWGIIGGTTDLQIYLSAANPWSFFNNDFDTCRINVLGTSTTNGYNAYLNCSGDGRLYPTNINDIVTNVGLAYQTGPLGSFYQPTNSPLIDKGSESVDDAGLTGYTILTNQMPDTGTVDIGYHYRNTGNDSTGTDFWLAFFSTQGGTDSYFDQSLYISSLVATAGKVAYPVNGPVLTITGDPAVNGTYVLTNTPESERNGYFLGPSMYVNGNLQVVFVTNGIYWVIWNYDPNSGPQYIYSQSGPDLNGSNWFGNGPGVTTFCPKVPFSQSFSVTAGMVTNVALPLDIMLDGYDAIEIKGIHVTASQPVSVYGLNYLVAASSAFTAYPTPMLGTNYCVMARASVSTYSDPSYHSQFAIVGTVTNTTVWITPSTMANLAGSMWTNSFTLNQGDTYEINSGGAYGDVTGTLITSDKPIAVFAGANGSHVPDQNTQALNPLVQEQLPVEQWGTNVLAISFAGRTNGDTYRILAAYNDTVVNITGKVVTILSEPVPGPWVVATNYETVTTNLAAGGFCDIILDGPAQFESTKPVQVAQFANGNFFDYTVAEEGDPCEILLSPTGCYLTFYTIYTPPNDDVTGDFNKNYVNIILPRSATNTTLMDGALVAATNFVPILNTGYYGAQISVTNGVHTVNSSQPIGVQVYGWGQADAYGYFGGVVK